MPPRSAPLQSVASEKARHSQNERHFKNNRKSSTLTFPNHKTEGAPPAATRSHRSINNRQRQRRSHPVKLPVTSGTHTCGPMSKAYDYSVPTSDADLIHQQYKDQDADTNIEQQQQQQFGGNVVASNLNVSPYSATNDPYSSNTYFGSSGTPGMMMMPPMYMGNMMGSGMGPFSGLYQALCNVQNVVFSISQAVHLVGMNQQVLQQSWESLSKMVDNAITTFYEMRTLERQLEREETEEDKQRKKRLKALRYALVVGGSWLAYKLVQSMLFQRRSRRQMTAAAESSHYHSGMRMPLSPYPSSSYHYGGSTGGGGIGYGNYGYSPMNNNFNLFNGSNYPGGVGHF